MGYEMAALKGREELESESLWNHTGETNGADLITATVPSTPLPSVESLAAAISSSLASKQPGSEQILSRLVAEAALAVMPKNPKEFNVDSVRVVKVLGSGLESSRMVRGMVFGREPDGESARTLRRL